MCLTQPAPAQPYAKTSIFIRGQIYTYTVYFEFIRALFTKDQPSMNFILWRPIRTCTLNCTQTGLCRQERACGHENCTPCKPIRAACAIFNMSKIKTAQTRPHSHVCECGHLSCRAFSPVAVFIVFCARGNRNMQASPRPQTWPMPTRSSNKLKFARTYLQRVDTHQFSGGKSAVQFARMNRP